ncbi:MAG: sigma-70 family RNA polymerase sigma factor [Candidatus Nanopelagicales bacterium]
MNDTSPPLVPNPNSELICENIPRVGYIVHEIASRLPSHADLDGLRSAGLLGLVRAAQAFDPSLGVPFRHYAATRIRGAILDELRSYDWASRSVRQTARRKEQGIEELTAAQGRVPTPAELAAYLGMSLDELHAVDDALHRSTVLSFDSAPNPDVFEPSLPTRISSPEDALVEVEQNGYLYAAIECLPERLRVVVQMYFLDGRPMADIAEVLDVTESRVSQMRAEALVLMRDGLNSQLDPEQVTPAERPGGVVDRRRAAYFAEIAQVGRIKLGREAREAREDNAVAPLGATRRLNGLA